MNPLLNRLFAPRARSQNADDARERSISGTAQTLAQHLWCVLPEGDSCSCGWTATNRYDRYSRHVAEQLHAAGHLAHAPRAIGASS